MPNTKGEFAEVFVFGFVFGWDFVSESEGEVLVVFVGNEVKLGFLDGCGGGVEHCDAFLVVLIVSFMRCLCALGRWSFISDVSGGRNQEYPGHSEDWLRVPMRLPQWGILSITRGICGFFLVVCGLGFVLLRTLLIHS